MYSNNNVISIGTFWMKLRAVICTASSELTIEQRRWIFSRPPDGILLLLYMCALLCGWTTRERERERAELICTFHASPGFSLGRFLLNVRAQTYTAHSPRSHYYYDYYYYYNAVPTRPYPLPKKTPRTASRTRNRSSGAGGGRAPMMGETRARVNIRRARKSNRNIIII